MTQRKLLLASLLSIVALSAYADSSSSVTPTLALRSQGRHADRQKWVGETNHTNLFDQQPWYGTFDVGLAYMSSFKSNRIAQCLFGSDIICDADVDSDSDCNDCGGSTILVQGSSVANRNAKAWLADYLYLNCDYNGSFSIKPRITNVMIDLDFYLGLDKIVDGMYCRFYGPITWTKWKTNFQPHDPDTVSTATCGIGYFTPSGQEKYLKNVASYFKGLAPESVDGVVFEGLKYAQMPSCHQSKAGFADLRGELGWNFYQCENYHVGINLQAAAPTGNRRYAQYVMQPVVGNGHHWELGAGLSAHYTFNCSNSDKSFGLYFDANITHLFKATEARTFDLKDRNNSRYMLAAKFTDNVFNFAQPTTTVAQLSGLPSAGTTVSAANPRTAALSQFDGVYTPVANISTFDVQVRVPVQADIVAMFNFSSRNISFDLGYNLWARSCENITLNVCCDPCDASLNCSEQKYALKGDSRMFGFVAATDGSGAAVGTAIALSASQNKADIYHGTNAAAVTTSCLPKQNCGVDNSQFAIAGTTPVRVIHTPLFAGGTDTNENQIKTSIQPIFLSTDDVAFVETRGLSNKVFTNFSYTWNDRDGWKPYLGVGGSAEFGQSCGCGSSEDCETECESTSCSTCTSCAVSQWAVWIKGGYAF